MMQCQIMKDSGLILWTQTAQYDSILGGLSSVVPLEMPLDISPLYAPEAEMMDMWTGSWLDNAFDEFF